MESEENEVFDELMNKATTNNKDEYTKHRQKSIRMNGIESITHI